MTTVVKASCDFCKSNLELKPEGVGLYTYSTKHVSDYYAFFCTNCRCYNRKTADQHIVSLLISAKVALTMIVVPLEVIERKHVLTPLTVDDLLALVAYLRDHDVLPEPMLSRRTRADRPQGAP